MPTGRICRQHTGGLGQHFFFKSMCSKKEEIKELDSDLDGGDCNVEGEISDPKDDVSMTA